MTTQKPKFMKATIAIASLLVISFLLSIVLKPVIPSSQAVVNFDEVFPKKIGKWTEESSPYLQVGLVAKGQYEDEKSLEQPYDQVLMRSYRHEDGTIVMLALAYAKQQTQDVKIHRPEVCYEAQGFHILNKSNSIFKAEDIQSPINMVRLLVASDDRTEAISYWIRIGNAYPTSPLEMRKKIFMDGLSGQVDDGILVRVSTIVEDPSNVEASYKKQEDFLQELLEATPKTNASILAF
ncbi:exosortase C-terminal domain/associated protein EpsI [Methylovorus sp. MP688]|uniref:exosortase C-terminal domain/associated protein EpsI n=1 Tax=Methylovorus sp. (strain MP688) TaxID=887061 RepID=UPI0001EC481E|nr:exosortase C-terminal domain/associated protein EpsI [Methylovorus sp. MP688]ADQ84988.1 EpsI family protein [Methylovorus sp. MP688]